ncbi:glycosyltransferase family 4 protein [Xanthomonas bonasiae]|uniref:glycosyltransferase family 4 protein n=1 Tax=Xanthomonas bonasiae TaxID=2810351 RepID=UPI00197F40E2|nr:glycosyltransferase [Xanthomonas bonasiae]MBN6110005.1 glycosyltransferase family 4 protein [Xanthomonas bonasiae]
MDQTLLSALVERDWEDIVCVLEKLAADDEREAINALISNLDICRLNGEQKAQLIERALGATSDDTHRWIIEDDIAVQRLRMIDSVVLPYVLRNFPEKHQFVALKRHERRAIAGEVPLIQVSALKQAILSPVDVDCAYTDAQDAGSSCRLPLPSTLFNTLLRLAWNSPDYLAELASRHDGDEFLDIVRSLHRIVPVYLTPTHLGYPMGGGESFIHQTCRILGEFGVHCVWLSFIHPHTGWYTESQTTHTPYYVDLRRATNDCEADIRNAMEHYCPDLVHAHGGTSEAVIRLADALRITTMVGYHFWNGLIELGKSGNQHIADHLDQHALAPAQPSRLGLTWKYVASEFMRDIYTALGGKEALHVVHPVPDQAQFMVQRDASAPYVAQVNVCALKGGRIFLKALRDLGDHIPFLGVRSEPDSSELYDQIALEMANKPRCVLQGYGNVRDVYRRARMVIVPTLVDETFCRVAFEAAMNGIPVLSTRNGYLPQMFGDSGIYLSEDPTEWVEAIARLYDDPALLEQIGQRQQRHLLDYFGTGADGFIDAALQLIETSTRRNVGIFTIWGDQGLGNLSHMHAKLLRRVGHKVHIFSFQPYSAIGRALVHQRDPEDWAVPAHADSVYYSFNCRENVSANELTQFLLANGVRTLLVPEICWDVNWQRLFSLEVPHLSICAIPMAEIVIRDEATHHNRLTTTFYCTRIAEQALTEAGVINGAFLGHGFGQALPRERLDAKLERLRQRKKIRFLHVAGHNPSVRKNTRQVMQAFALALQSRDDIELTITSMDPVATYHSDPIPQGLKIIDYKLSRQEILDLYEAHDVSIQVSSHEGLGLGFYESIGHGTPVISLDCPPHNEVVQEGATGWLIPSWPIPAPDNDRAIVSAYRFSTTDLAMRILMLERDAIHEVTASCGPRFMMQFDETALLTRFIQILPR